MSLLGSLFGAGMGHSISGSLGQSMNSALGSQNPYMNQGMAAQQRAAYMAQQQQMYQAAVKPEWMIAGKAMSITEFADELFGDTPQRTMFLLKYSDKGK
jgi:hypothetical protein